MIAEHVHTGPGCRRKPVSEWPDNGTNSFPRIGGFSITDRSELTITIQSNILQLVNNKYDTYIHQLHSNTLLIMNIYVAKRYLWTV